eukprot:COSAG06_NODE_20885_length_777_cov_3.747788_1_plen_80_part_10
MRATATIRRRHQQRASARHRAIHPLLLLGLGLDLEKTLFSPKVSLAAATQEEEEGRLDQSGSCCLALVPSVLLPRHHRQE